MLFRRDITYLSSSPPCVVGQKIKLVIAACLWNNPQVRVGCGVHSQCKLNSPFFRVTQICVLDEPSNFLDREALGGLAVAIRDWAGAVVRDIT